MFIGKTQPTAIQGIGIKSNHSFVTVWELARMSGENGIELLIMQLHIKPQSDGSIKRVR
jgi:hypothetical protein